jgi:hypothetical protein
MESKSPVINNTDTAVEVDIIEKIFDSVACYFPITFNPPEDDPYGVTSEMLITSLENIFCAHSALHKHVLPFLMDNMVDETSLARVQVRGYVYEYRHICIHMYMYTNTKHTYFVLILH